MTDQQQTYMTPAPVRSLEKVHGESLAAKQACVSDGAQSTTESAVTGSPRLAQC